MPDSPPSLPGSIFGISPYPAPELKNPPSKGKPSPVASRAAGQDVVRASVGKSVSVNCPNCGGSVEVRDVSGTAMVVCSHCQSALGPTSQGLKLLYQAQQESLYSHLPMGTTGKLHGKQWTVIGRIRFRECDYSGYWAWDSYQLFSDTGEYAFLEVENGHWMFFEPLRHRVKMDPRRAQPKQKFSLEGQTYKVFERSECEIVYVEGELSWVARLGDKNYYMDAIRPPHLVSAEWTEKEMEWSIGRYHPPADLEKAFSLEKKLPTPQGVAPAQPFIRTEDQTTRIYAGWGVTAVLIALGIFTGMMDSGKNVYTSPFINSSQYNSEDGYLSQPIDIPSGRHICKLAMQAPSVNNQWVDASIAIVDEEDNVILDADGTMEYYHGYEGGESWSEGSSSSYSLMRVEGPATYRLNVFGSSGQWSQAGGDRATVSGQSMQVAMVLDVVPARYYFLAALLTCIYPVWQTTKKVMFESSRWPSDDDDD